MNTVRIALQVRGLLVLVMILAQASTAAADEPKLPKTKARDNDPIEARGEWFGKKVLPKRNPDKMQIGDWEGDKIVYWKPHNLQNCTVREDRDGFLRLYDCRREGWVLKEDMVTAEDAPAYFDQAVKANPEDAFGLYMRGNAWFETGEYDKAIKDFNEFLRLFPTSCAGYCIRGRAWESKKDYDKAIADFTQAIQLDPKNAIAFNNRGFTLISKKEYDKAIADFNQAIRLDPQFSGAFNNRGGVLLVKKEYDKAIADNSQAIRLNPKGVHAYIGRGMTYYHKKEYNKAIADFNQTLQIEPNSVGIVNALAWIHATCPDAKLRDGKKAVELSKKAVVMAGKEITWYLFGTLAAAYAEAGDFELAVTEQRKAIDMAKANKLTDAEELKKAEARLELYKAKKPYREK